MVLGFSWEVLEHDFQYKTDWPFNQSPSYITYMECTFCTSPGAIANQLLRLQLCYRLWFVVSGVTGAEIDQSGARFQDRLRRGGQI